METKTYAGQVSVRDYGDSDDVLFISSNDDPLAEILERDISGRTVTARYWITEKEASKEEAQESFIRQIMGVAESIFQARYSDITGYLWTDEDIKIGGHDLLGELEGCAGKWLILEIDIHSDE